MASDNDFSAITQLMDVKRLYEEQEEKWRLRLTEKDEEVSRYVNEIQTQRRTVEGRTQAITELDEEIARRVSPLTYVRPGLPPIRAPARAPDTESPATAA